MLYIWTDLKLGQQIGIAIVDCYHTIGFLHGTPEVLPFLSEKADTRNKKTADEGHDNTFKLLHPFAKLTLQTVQRNVKNSLPLPIESKPQSN